MGRFLAANQGLLLPSLLLGGLLVGLSLGGAGDVDSRGTRTRPARHGHIPLGVGLDHQHPRGQPSDP